MLGSTGDKNDETSTSGPGFGLPLLWPQLAAAAEFDGKQLSPLWGVPFAGILLSIALMPLLAPCFWHHHYGKVAAAWALAFLRAVRR